MVQFQQHRWPCKFHLESGVPHCLGSSSCKTQPIHIRTFTILTQNTALHPIMELACGSLVVLPCPSVTRSTHSRPCLQKQEQATQLVRITVKFFSIECFFLRGKWATLGGSVIPRQPVAGMRQASFPTPGTKNHFNI